MAVQRRPAEATVPWGELSPSGRRRWAVRAGEEEADSNDDDDSAVLVLGHFSRPPFLSFGTVRVGTSRSRRLALENPNDQPVLVAVGRPPPASKGFAVEQFSSCLLQQAFNAAAVVHHMKKLHMNCHHGGTNAAISLPVIEVQDTSSLPVTSQEQPSQDESFHNELDLSDQHNKMTDGMYLNPMVSKSLPLNACTATEDNQSISPFGCSSACGTHEKVKPAFCSESVLFKKTVKSQRASKGFSVLQSQTSIVQRKEKSLNPARRSCNLRWPCGHSLKRWTFRGLTNLMVPLP